MKDEVAQGIKNAIERGQSLDSAIASFVNAGYSESEVHEAANSLNNSASSLLPLREAPADSMDSKDTPAQTGMFKLQPTQNIPSPAPIAKATNSQSPQQLPVSTSSEKKDEGVSKTKVVVLSIILLLLLIGLGVTIFFKDAIFGQ